jgi:DNA ligase 4
VSLSLCEYSGFTSVDPLNVGTSFVSLLYEISKASQCTAWNPSNGSHPILRMFIRWVAELRRKYSPLPRGTTAAVFLLLFPEEDSRRKYDMQETRLSRELAKCFGVSMKGRGESLRLWNGETTVGCLGGEVMKVLDEASSVSESNHVDFPTLFLIQLHRI